MRITPITKLIVGIEASTGSAVIEQSLQVAARTTHYDDTIRHSVWPANRGVPFPALDISDAALYYYIPLGIKVTVRYVTHCQREN